MKINLKTTLLIILSIPISYYLMDMLVFTGFSDPFLKIKSAQSADVLVRKFDCSNKYSWNIVEKDIVIRGNLTSTSKPSELRKFLTLQLSNSNEVLNEFSPYDQVYGRTFPTGENFSSALIMKKDLDNVFSKKELDDYLISFELSSDIINSSDFDIVSNCLKNNLTDIEKMLSFKDIPYKIGWIMRVDNNIERDLYSGAPTFKCNDGQTALTNGTRLAYISTNDIGRTDSRPQTKIGMIGPDGKIYKDVNDPSADMSQVTIDVPNINCVNSNGLSLESFLESIPNRIKILN